MKTINLVAAFLLAIPASQAVAAEDYDQIVVTAARTPLAVSKIGSAVTIITRDDIERRHVRHLADLLRSVPGFSVSRTGAIGAQTQIRVRGAEANHILVLIDGIRANDPATGDEFRWEYLSTANIERIEIVRGPQSSLWGSDAVAAVVHVITRVRKTGSDFSAYAESGSHATSNLGMNGAVASARWSLSGGIERLTTDGSNISRSGSENDDSALTTATLAARIEASEALSFRLGLRAVDAYTQFDPVDYFVTGLPVDGDVATDVRHLYASIGGTLRSLQSRVTHRVKAHYFDSSNRNLVDGGYDSGTASTRLTLAYQADIGIGKNLLSLALEHEKTQFEQRGAVIFGDPNQDQEMTVTSVIAEYQGLSGERMSWILSARLDNNSDFDDSLNGRLSIAYQWSGTTTLRGGVGTGQKNPTFTERFGYFPEQFIGNAALKPERSTSYDIGLDKNVLNGEMQIQISLFRQDLVDEINGFVFDPVTFLSTAENLTSKSKRSGMEIAVRWTLSESLALGGHYTNTRSTAQGSREVRRPRHSGGMSADFRSPHERFTVTLHADYGGTRSDIFFPPYPTPPQIVTLRNYWLLDIAAQYQATPTVTVFVRGTNLLDEDYEQVYGYRTLGRAAYLGVRVNFGR